mmetsp:Transcript_17643/g.68486  ORF Transcript_17643/g.68486 Transcript_17643/m.68486 type:complete len:318 (-) Transcript_17643:154-1107(-)
MAELHLLSNCGAAVGQLGEHRLHDGDRMVHGCVMDGGQVVVVQFGQHVRRHLLDERHGCFLSAVGRQRDVGRRRAVLVRQRTGPGRNAGKHLLEGPRRPVEGHVNEAADPARLHGEHLIDHAASQVAGGVLLEALLDNLEEELLHLAGCPRRGNHHLERALTCVRRPEHLLGAHGLHERHLHLLRDLPCTRPAEALAKEVHHRSNAFVVSRPRVHAHAAHEYEDCTRRLGLSQRTRHAQERIALVVGVLQNRSPNELHYRRHAGVGVAVDGSEQELRGLLAEQRLAHKLHGRLENLALRHAAVVEDHIHQRKVEHFS